MASETVEIIYSVTDKASSALRNIAGSMEGVGKFALAAAAGGVAALAGGMVKLAQDAEAVPGIAEGFRGLTQNVEGGADAMLAALQQASSGLTDNVSLMQSYNSAAQLIGQDFAATMPDAIETLGKVSAATGEDLGFLIDSYVRGVGRLSPAILDNLSVQVDLTSAQEAYAETLGKSADELTKNEQQMAVAQETMRQLAINTASLPDPSAPFQSFRVMLQNMATDIGVKVLPAIAPMIDVFGRLISDSLPKVLELLDPLISAFANFATQISNGVDPLTAFTGFVSQLIFHFGGTSQQVQAFNNAVWGAINAVQEFIQPIVDWVAGFVELEDILIVVGIAVAAFAASVLISIAPIVLTIGAVVLAVAALRSAWESDFLGMRTALTNAWENHIAPALEMARLWLAENLPIALEKLRDFWENVLLPGIKRVWAWVQDTLFPLLEDLWAWLGETIPVVLEKLRSFWEDVLLPGIQNVWSWIEGSLLPTLEKVWEWLGETIPVVLDELAWAWENLLLPAIELVWQFIEQNLVPLFEALLELLDVSLKIAIEALTGLWENVLLPALKDAWAFIKENVNPILETLKGVLDGVGGAVQGVIGWIRDLIGDLGNLTLPDWLTPGSPTPFELGLRGISDALRELDTIALPRLQAQFMSTTGAPGVVTQAGAGTSNYYSLTVQSSRPDDVARDFRIMQAFSGGI